MSYKIVYFHKKLMRSIFERTFGSQESALKYMNAYWSNLKKRGLTRLKKGDYVILTRLGLLFRVTMVLKNGCWVKNLYTGKETKVEGERLSKYFTVDNKFLKDRVEILA